MQSRKQRTNSLIKYAKSQSEQEIIVALDDIKIKEITRDEADRLIEVVGKWGFYMGSSSRLTSDDILMLCKFLKENYNFLTINEINLVIGLNLKGALGKVEYYGNLSPLYMSQVLNNYLEYRKDNLQGVLERRDRDEVKPTPRMSKEELLQMTKDAIKLEYTKYQKGEVVDDLLSIVYNFLTKNNRLNPNEESKRNAFTYAQKMIVREKVKQAKTIGDLVRNAINKDDSLEFERHYQNGLLIDLFSTIENIDEYINGLNINEIL